MLKKILASAFAVNSLILFAGSMVGNVLNYVFHLVTGRLVTPAAYGEIEALISLMSIVSVPSLTVAMVVTKLSACNKADQCPADSRKIFSFFTKNTFVYGAPLFLLLVLLNPYIAEWLRIDNRWALMMVWITLFLSFFYSVNLGILGGWQKFKDSSIASAAGTAIKLLVGVSLIYIGYQVSGALASFVAAGIATYIFSLWFLRFIFKINSTASSSGKLFGQASLKNLLVTFLLGNLTLSILGNADMVLAKRNLADDLAGQYGALNIVAKVIFFATGVIATVVFSMAAEKIHRKENTRKLMLNALLIIALVGVFSTIFYFLFPNFVLGLLFGSKYSAVTGYLGWFALAVLFYSLNNLFLQYSLSAHRTQMIYPFLLISLIMMVVIFLYGNSIFAIISIVIAMQMVGSVFGLYMFWRSKELT